MSITINLTAGEEAQLSAAATQNGLAPEALAEKLVREHLPTADPAYELTKKLRERQAQDRVNLMPSRSAAELFAQWDEEAAQMTDEEREAEDRIYAEIEKNGIPRMQI